MHVVVDAGPGGQGAGGAFVVAGEHGDPDAGGMQILYGFGGFGSQFIADADDADHRAVEFDDGGGGTGFLEAGDVRGEAAGR